MELPEHYDPTTVEQAVRTRWAETDVREHLADGETFSFVDGPPFTSGRMHCGTAFGKVLKDALLRYHRQRGRDVHARPGYDTHGLPVEVQVEADHGFERKDDVETYGVEAFTADCREYVTDQQAAMDTEFRDLAVWMDWERSYRTMDADYMETVWDAFAGLYEQGLVERGRRVVNTCPRCETALSDAELEYGDRTTTAAFVAFPLDGEAAALLTWTTTPWTVVGNRFVAVDAEATYALVAVEGWADRLYVASDRVESAMADCGVEDWHVVSELPGSDLVGRTYAHPLADHVNGAMGGSVAHADYVDVTGDGTGVVHSAPGLGHEDHERGRELGLDPFAPVSTDGRFTDAAGPYAGLAVHGDGDAAVRDDLDDAGALVGATAFDHEYPHCPRCDAEVVYRASEQWLVRVTELKPDLLDALDETEWHPADARDERFRNVVEAAPDWNVSRQRYWGTPVPVWCCVDCGNDVVVGTRAELADCAGLDEPLEDLHRPAVDDLTLDCPDCGGDAERVTDVLDVWFDSAVASWVSRDALPREEPRPEGWPADLVVEGYDQTRGWFLMQLVLGVALAGRAPYEEVVMHGFALLDGEPMSKSSGHVLRPPSVVDEHGRDALRARLLAAHPHERDFDMDSDMGDVATYRDRLDVVWNVVRFATTYADADDVALTADLDTDPDDLPTLDRWLLSRCHATVERATAAFEERRPDEALAATLDLLVDDVSRFYVQTARERVWEQDDSPSKAAAYDTLGTTLHACVRLLAPHVPHLAERLYSALDGECSTVHAAGWPTADGLELPRDEPLEERVATLRDVEAAVATARDRLGRKRRWPVAEVVVEGDVAATVDHHAALLAERTNADRVRAGPRHRKRVCEPDMRALGPAVGDAAERVADAVDGTPVDDLPREVAVGEETHTVTDSHVSVAERSPDGWVVEEFDGGAVRVDTACTAAMRRRGVVRDLVRHAQERRAALDLALDERVTVRVTTANEALRAAAREHRGLLASELRATAVQVNDDTADSAAPSDAGTDRFTVDGEPVTVTVAPADERASPAP